MLPGNLEARTCSLEALDTIQVLAEFLKSLQKEIHLDYILSMLTVPAALQPLHPPTATCAQIQQSSIALDPTAVKMENN